VFEQFGTTLFCRISFTNHLAICFTSGDQLSLASAHRTSNAAGRFRQCHGPTGCGWMQWARAEPPRARVADGIARVGSATQALTQSAVRRAETHELPSGIFTARVARFCDNNISSQSLSLQP